MLECHSIVLRIITQLMKEKIEKQLKIPDEMAGRRVDQAVAELIPDYSRARLQQWMKQGQLTLNGASCRPKDKVFGGEVIELNAEIEDQGDWQAEPIPLDISYEDDDIIVVNKPAGLVVHPAAGNRTGTLVNALLHHDANLITLPRAGIVHRLDKDTTGLLVVARSLPAHTALVAQLQAREIHRHYLAVTTGEIISGGSVEAPIGRHPHKRTQMAVVPSGKPAITHYRVAERFRQHTLLSVQLETGRTHQIRVHMAHIHHALLGDPVYGQRLHIPSGATDVLITQLRQFKRQALHASALSLSHPCSGEWYSWEAPLAEDMQILIAALQNDRDAHA